MEHKSLNIGELDVLDLDLSYIENPSHFYHTLCRDRPNTLLLESVDIDSKQELKSLMLIDAALKIRCNHREVRFEALTKNGYCLIEAIKRKLSEYTCQVKQIKNILTLYFPSPENTSHNTILDEDQRLYQPSSLDALRLVQKACDISGHPPNALFLGGLFSYDLIAEFEDLPEVEKETSCPDYLFYVSEVLLIVDHQQQTSKLQGTLFGGENAEIYAHTLRDRIKEISKTPLCTSISPESVKLPDTRVIPSIPNEAFCLLIEELKQYIIKGEVYQIVPSRYFKLNCPSPFLAYNKLKCNNPSPYMFYLQDDDFVLFGASPESALKYSQKTNQVELYPIAGTRRRGKYPDGRIHPDLDGRIELELRNDHKENAEHMMLVDLARNDIARISETGTRHVTNLLKVDRYSHVMHLVSRVAGQLRQGLDALHAYQSCMNMGTLTGAPKVRAMQLIRQFEKRYRGSYGGAVGYLTGQGDLDTCIVIRSAYVEDGFAYVQAGGGIVFDSIPQAEVEETQSKAQAILIAIQNTYCQSDKPK